MQVVVVADEKRETIGRQLAQAISVVECPPFESGTSGVPPRALRHSAVFWTEKHFQDNEASLVGDKVAVVFIGPSRAGSDLAEVMPRGWEAHGVHSHLQGRRAVLLADTPKSADADDLKTLARQLEVATQLFAKDLARFFAEDFAKVFGAGLIGLIAAGPILGVAAGGAFWLVNRRDLAKLRKRVQEAQYRYAATRFVFDGLPALVGDQPGAQKQASAA